MRVQRGELDALPEGAERPMLVCVDGRMANRSFLRALPERTEFLARVRGDAALDAPFEGRGPRKYGARLATPEEQGKEPSGWTTARAYGAGRLHDFAVREVTPVLWRTLTGARPLRLIVIAPLRYRATPNSRLQYRNSAYLLTSDLTTSLDLLV